MNWIKKISVVNLILYHSLIGPVFATDHLSSYISRAKEAEKLGKPSVAIKWYRKALLITGNQELKINILFHIGDCYYALNNQVAALNLYKEALKDPRSEKYLIHHPKTYLNLANIYFNHGEYHKAAEIYLKIGKRYKNKSFTAFALVKAGDSLFNLKEYKKALEAYSKVILMYKESKEYWITRFRMADLGISHPGLNVPNYMEYRDYLRPKDAYKDILKNAPDNMKRLRLLAHLRIATVYLKEKRHLDAINRIKFVMRHDLDSDLTEYARKLMINIVSQFIDMLQKKKDYLRIYKVFKAIKAEIPLSQLHEVTREKIAEALYHLDMCEDALSIYLMNPQKNVIKIASIYNQLGRYKRTINLLAPLKSKLDLDTALILAKAYYEEKRFKDVVDLLVPKIKDISNPEAYYLLANSYDRLGNKEKTIYYLQLLSKEDSEYKLNACLSLGNILFELKKYKSALSYYKAAQRICKTCPDSDFIRLQMASCYYQMGDYKRSAEILNKMEGDGLIRWVSNIQLELMQLENTYRELRWLIE